VAGGTHRARLARPEFHIDERFTVTAGKDEQLKKVFAFYRIRLSNLDNKREKAFSVLIENGKTTKVDLNF
jgi:hypothetical protein